MRKRLCVISMFISLCLATARGDGLTLTPIDNQDPSSTSLGSGISDPASVERIWRGEVGCGLLRNAQEVNLSPLLAFGMKPLGIGTINHDLALATLNYGWVCSDVVCDNKFVRGNWELVANCFAGAQYHPDTRYVVGLTPLIRYNFITGTRWVPFINGGAGSAFTDIGVPDLATKFEFNLQGGIGMHYFWRKNRSFTLECRYFHISDAGISQPNQGVDNIAVLFGYSWFF